MDKSRIRVSSGKYKGKFLEAPKIEKFRSVQDIARQAVFSIIGADNLLNTYCLDLFAGSGIMGIEALSREAAYVDLVDENYEAVGAIRNTLDILEIPEDTAKAHRLKSVKFVEKALRNNRKYHIIFCDPFYDDLKHKHLFNLIPQILEKNGVFVFFHDPEQADYYDEIGKKAGLKLTERRKFGDSAFSIFTH
jgi:16S rRNA (guanine966-N2)-methyltransferase